MGDKPIRCTIGLAVAMLLLGACVEGDDTARVEQGASDNSQQAERGHMSTRYYRLYSDENGDSHLESEEVSFSLVDFAPPAPPLNMAQLGAAENCLLLKAPPGWEGDWHPAPYRQLHFYLSGELEVETSDRRTSRIGPGAVVLVEDISGKGHRSRVLGSNDVIVAAVKLAGTE